MLLPPSPVIAVSRRDLLLCGGALCIGGPAFADNKQTEDRALLVTTQSGASYKLTNTAFRSYYGARQIFLPNPEPTDHITSEPGEILLAQGWQWITCPLQKISRIEAVDDIRSTPGDVKIVKTKNGSAVPKLIYLLSLLGLPFVLYSQSIFKVVFVDGTEAWVNMFGDLINREAAAAERYIALKDVRRLAMTADGKAEIVLRAKTVQADMSSLTMSGAPVATAETGSYLNTVHFLRSKTLSVIIDPDESPGGIMVELAPQMLQGRTLTLLEKDPALIVQKRFHLSGLTDSPIDCGIGRIIADRAQLPSGIAYIDTNYARNGFAARLFVPIERMSKLTLTADEKSTIATVALSYEDGPTVQLDNLRIASCGCAIPLFGFSKAQPLHVIMKPADRDVAFADIQSLRRVKAPIHGNPDKTLIVLTSGESVLGFIDSEQDFSICGNITYAGLPATASLFLPRIAAWQWLSASP